MVSPVPQSAVPSAERQPAVATVDISKAPAPVNPAVVTPVVPDPPPQLMPDPLPEPQVSRVPAWDDSDNGRGNEVTGPDDRSADEPRHDLAPDTDERVTHGNSSSAGPAPAQTDADAGATLDGHGSPHRTMTVESPGWSDSG